MKFFYLRDEKRNPVACVASEINEFGSIEFAISTHNPIDPFDKNIAKAVAAGRLKTSSDSYGMPMMPRIKWHICKSIAFNSSLPVKTRKAATLWLNEHQEGTEEN